MLISSNNATNAALYDAVAFAPSYDTLAFAPDGSLATGTWAGVVQLWNPANGEEREHDEHARQDRREQEGDQDQPDRSHRGGAKIAGCLLILGPDRGQPAADDHHHVGQ